MIEIERLNGINNRQGTSRANKVYKELLIANYPIKERFKNVWSHEIKIDNKEIEAKLLDMAKQAKTCDH